MDKEFNYNIKPIYIAIGATLATAFTTKLQISDEKIYTINTEIFPLSVHS